MHIPDGYLSPATCAALYAAVVPFWYIALQRLKRVLKSRLVPLLSVVAALSFVIMMFNVPLPGGTTGHAVGVGIAAIVLGPLASMVAISVALLIQALFFGDGGITAFGANSFNMAIVGSFVASGVYRIVGGRTALMSKRRLVAAFLAGYAAINAAAFCASIEFGIQPMLFTDSGGTPLYAPYPLSIAVPAMMIGHLTFAGLAEGIVSGGVFAYLQRTDSSLLRVTGGAATDAATVRNSGWRMTRSLWTLLACLMILTPLGLFAAGTAWGEWKTQNFIDPALRREMTVASGNHAPPAEAPKGLARLGSVWTAPMADYAPPFLTGTRFGYMVSAIFGVGLSALVFLVASPFAKLIVYRRGRRDTAASKDVGAPRMEGD